jgi:hypothetical protein
MPDDKKPIPVGPGERTDVIAPPKNSIAAMTARGVTAQQMRIEIANGPHWRTEADVGELQAIQQPRSPLPKPPSSWARGDRAYDKKRGVRVTILKASVGKTAKGTPLHEVTHNGERWLAKDTTLQRN